MKIPKSFGQPMALTAFHVKTGGDAEPVVAKPQATPQPVPLKMWLAASGMSKEEIQARDEKLVESPKPGRQEVRAEGDVARWWVEMSPEAKKEYVAEHPNSKYAEMHKSMTGQEPGKTSPTEKKAPKPQTPAPTKSKGPGHPGHAPQKTKPSEKPPANSDHENVGTPAKPTMEDLKHPDMKPGGEKRKAAVGFLRKKTGHIISHLKKDAKEWKTAGVAMKKLATGKSLEHEDKHAMGAVAADIAAVTASLLLTGGAAHGIVAFVQHFGTHLAQEALLKAAVKGAAGAAAHHASIKVLTTASDEEQMMQNAIKEMMDMLENGDLEEMMKKFESEAQKEGKGAEVKKDLKEAKVQASTEVEAKLNMSAEHAGSGNCPDCSQPMVIAMAGDAPSWGCKNCRISLPLPDDHEYFKKQGQGTEAQVR